VTTAAPTTIGWRAPPIAGRAADLGARRLEALLQVGIVVAVTGSRAQATAVPLGQPIVDAARKAVTAFVAWLDAYGETSQDPYDFWNTSLGGRAKALYHRGGAVGKLAAAPFVALDTLAPRSRALVRPRNRSAIGDAHYARGFFALAEVNGEEQERHVARGRAFLDALDRQRSPGYEDPAWGYTFDWTTRYGVWPAGLPMITTIPYAYEAFEAGYAAVGEPAYLQTMEGIARFAAERIPVTAVGPGAEAGAYTPIDRRRVVNANAYRGYLLVSAGLRFGRDDWEAAGRRNIEFVLDSQRADGSWPYSTDGTDDFVDNFHTCFVLKNLLKIWALTGEERLRDSVLSGYGFYLAHLIDDAGLPVPFAERPRLTLHRRDLYDYAEGINLALLARELIPEATAVLESLTRDLVERWQLPDGHFVTRQLAVGRNTVPYHRWAQSQTFHALARLLASDG
jgi:hypothetical protein